MDKAYNLYNIEALFKEYLSAENNNLHATTIKNYMSDFKHFIGWLQSSKIVEDGNVSIESLVTDSSLRRYLQYLNSQNIPLKTLSRRLSTVRKFLQFSSEKGLNLMASSSTLTQEKEVDVKKTSVPELKSTQFFSKPRYRKFVPKDTLKPAQIYALAALTIVVLGFLLIKAPTIFKASVQSKSATPIKSGRVFAFQGKLTDKLGNNITSLTSIQFKLYNSLLSKNPVYQTGLCTVTPDRNGYFSVLIGGATIRPHPQQDSCGKEVGAEIFTENSGIYLGTTVSTDEEMSPRQQIANVGYSVNSETLKGLPLGSTNSSVPYITPDGSVVLSLNSPSLTSTYTSGTFSIKSGSDLLLQSANDGNITLNATGSGAIRLRTNGSELDRIYISDGGNVGINTSFPSVFRLEVSGDVGPDLGNAYDLGSTTRIWNDVYANRLCLDGSSDCISSSQGIFSALDTSFVTQLNIKGNLVGGNSVNSGTTTLDIGGTTTSYALCHSSQNGTDNEKIVDCNSTPTADFAEIYPMENGAEYGDLMVLGNKVVKTTKNEDIRQLVKSAKSYDHHVIGVVSDNHEDFISVGHNIASEHNPMPIALKGRVPVKISQLSQPITAGDYLTTSTEKGKAMKATEDGVMIGRALESWEPGSVKNKVMVFVGIDYVVQNNNPVKNLAENLSAFVSAQFQSLTAQKLISPVVETSEIRPESGKDLVINLSPEDSNATPSSQFSKLAIQGLKKAVVASIDAEGNIKSKGTVEAENGIFNKSITADTIKSKTTDNLSENLNDVQTKLAKLSQSSSTTPTPSPIAPNTLAAIAHESLASHLIVTDLAEIRSLSIQDSIIGRADTLRLASNSSISFFDDSVTFEKNGNVVTKGRITAKEFAIKNSEGNTVSSVSATGSATFNQLQLPKSAGFAILPEGENEVQVKYADLTDSSLIYITPETSLGLIDKPLVVKDRHLCKASEPDCISHFTVALNTNNHANLRFNWLIIN